jgi:hypothetical protein
MAELTKETLERFEDSIADIIDNCYDNINELYYELSYLYESQKRYVAPTRTSLLPWYERNEQLDEIHNRIRSIFDTIRYYKDCITAHNNELKRLYKAYYKEEEDNRSNNDELLYDDNLSDIISDILTLEAKILI